MTEASDLEKAHAQLVKQRRSIIEALAKGYQAGQTEINRAAAGDFRARLKCWIPWPMRTRTRTNRFRPKHQRATVGRAGKIAARSRHQHVRLIAQRRD